MSKRRRRSILQRFSPLSLFIVERRNDPLSFSLTLSLVHIFISLYTHTYTHTHTHTHTVTFTHVVEEKFVFGHDIKVSSMSEQAKHGPIHCSLSLSLFRSLSLSLSSFLCLCLSLSFTFKLMLLTSVRLFRTRKRKSGSVNTFIIVSLIIPIDKKILSP